MRFLPQNNRAFTLVELLVVMVIMGLVISSVYSLFISNKKAAATSEEVVDIQQNLRVAMETMVADIRMAGFMIPYDSAAVPAAPASLSDTDLLQLNLATGSGRYARIVNSVSGTNITLDAGMSQLFTTEKGIRIIQPTNPNSATDYGADVVTGVDTGSETLTVTSVSADNRDVVVLLDSADNIFPSTISYQLDEGLLKRKVNSGNYETIAANISAVELNYLPSAVAPKSVGVKITAEKSVLQQDKTREIQTTVMIQNASGD